MTGETDERHGNRERGAARHSSTAEAALVGWMFQRGRRKDRGIVGDAVFGRRIGLYAIDPAPGFVGQFNLVQHCMRFDRGPEIGMIRGFARDRRSQTAIQQCDIVRGTSCD